MSNKWQEIGKYSSEAVSKKKDMGIAKIMKKSQKKIKKVANKKPKKADPTLSGRAQVFHIFKAHKKPFNECTPCKHILYFLKYEAKHKYGIIPQPALTFAAQPQQPNILKDDWSFGGSGTAAGPSLSGGTTTTTAAPGGTTYYAGGPKDDIFAMTIDPSHPIIVAKSGEYSITHVIPKPLSLKVDDTIPEQANFGTCTSNLKPPKLASWKSHTVLCTCGGVTIKWMP
jgi:hypothetical protein